MLPEEVEARFRRIEDVLTVIVELQRRSEARSQEDIQHLKAVQDAMAQWVDRIATRQDEFEDKLNALIDIQQREGQEVRALIADLGRTVDRFLRTRTNGGN